MLQNLRQSKTVTAAELAADGERLAPVSGARCRDCGKSAVLRPTSEKWCLLFSTAYCPECASSYEPFTLANDAAKPRAARPENMPTRQRTLLSGLDCLPGQGDLFAVDGAD